MTLPASWIPVAWVPWLAALGTALVQMVWQAALVGCGLVAARMPLRRGSARARYAGSCLALFLLPAVFVGTLLGARNGGADWVPMLGNWMQGALPWLAAAWALGVVLWCGYSLGGWLLLRRVRRGASLAIPEEWRQRLAALRERVGVAEARLGLTGAVRGPCVVGWWRPLILLPLSALTAMPAEQLEALLAHELAHIRRRDYLVNLMQRAVEVAFFYHPAVWWISRQVSEEREHCCDDIAMAACGDRLGYARALVNLAETNMTRREAPMACAASGGSLPRRIRRIVAGEPHRRWEAWRAAAGMSALAAMGICLAAALAMPRHFAMATPAPVAPSARAELASFSVPLSLAVRPARRHAVARTVRPKPLAKAAAPTQLARRARPAPPVVVGFALAKFEACGPRRQTVRVLLPDGSLWVGVRTVMQCEPVLQPVGVLVG